MLARSMAHTRESLLELDRDLAKDLPDDDEQRAREHLHAEVIRLNPGIWDPGPTTEPAQGGFGLFIAEGFLVRSVTLGHRSAGELLGPGDLLRPWQEDQPHSSYPLTSKWRALSPVTLAILGRDVTRHLCGFPSMIAQLAERMAERTRRQAGYQVISQLAAVEHRILLALWHMADEFGRVRTDGVHVPVPMTHEVLGMLVGARRPTVTAALGTLVNRGLLTVSRREGWLLLGEAPLELDLVRGSRL
jgi:CRP-like cAMP-binding protein